MRDHEPIEITEFNGLWKRGDRESTPEDHFSDCNNIEFIESGFQSRPGIAALDIDDACDNLQNVVRMYTYLRPDRQSLLVLNFYFFYVFLGEGAAARKAGGLAPTGVMTGANGDPINTKLQAGYHIFAVVFETDTGFLTKLGGNEIGRAS